MAGKETIPFSPSPRHNLLERNKKELERKFTIKTRELTEYTNKIQKLNENSEKSSKTTQKQIQDLENELNNYKFNYESNEKKWAEFSENEGKFKEKFEKLAEKEIEARKNLRIKEEELKVTKGSHQKSK